MLPALIQAGAALSNPAELQDQQARGCCPQARQLRAKPDMTFSEESLFSRIAYSLKSTRKTMTLFDIPATLRFIDRALQEGLLFDVVEKPLTRQPIRHIYNLLCQGRALEDVLGTADSAENLAQLQHER
jgi:hypothetical protein